MSESSVEALTAGKLPTWTVVGFSGHRSLPDEEAAARGIAAALDELQQRCGALAAVASAASGGDTLFLEAAAQRRMPIHVVLPFELDRFERDFEPGQWRRVTPLIDSAIERTVVRGTDSDSEAYFDAGVLTVDQCDVLLAVWDGDAAAGRGGTGDVVAYADSIGRPLIIVDPQTGALARRRLDSADAGCAAGGAPLPPDADPHAIVQAAFHTLDEHARRRAPEARLLVLRIILLHLLASALAIGGVVLEVHGAWAYIVAGAKVAALAWAVVLVGWHHRAHHVWVDTRPAAELCRSFLALWPLRREGAILPRVQPGVSPALGRSLAMLWRLDHNAQASLQQARTQYLRNRLEDQLTYFDREGGRAQRRNSLLRRLAAAATWAAIAAGLVVLALMLAHRHGPVYQVAKLLSIVLPLATAAILSLAVAHDLGRRVVRYRDVQQRLQAAQKRVAAAQTWPALWRAVADVEQHLLDEIAEWRAITRFTGESH